MSWLREAFSVTVKDEGKLTEKQSEIMDKIAQKVVRWGMAVPAILFLETMKPLSFIGSQVLVFFDPFVKSLFNIVDYETFTVMMEDRRNVEELLLRIEKMESQSQEAKKLRGGAENGKKA